MRKRAALDALLPKTRQGILAATLGRPGKPWYASELARRLGVPPSSLQRELGDLTAAGILKTHRQGRMAFYQANTDSPLFPDLRGLMLKTAGLADALAPLSPKIQSSFVFGSIASGTEQNDSDIDLMVIGVLAPLDLALPLRQARDSLDREINPTVVSPAEFARKRAAKEHFLTRVLDKQKLFVIGNQNDLGKGAS